MHKGIRVWLRERRVGSLVVILLVLTFGATATFAPAKVERTLPMSLCQPHYECRDWQYFIQWGCGCDGNPCCNWYKHWAKKYWIDRNCYETLVGTCVTIGCIHEAFACCGMPGTLPQCDVGFSQVPKE